jgi:subtilisin family serine protease
VRLFELQTLEERRLLSWGTYPQLIEQNVAAANYPKITGAGVNIALIDSGVDFSQPNLQGKFWTNPGEIAGNGKDDDGDGYVDDTRGWDFYNNDNNPEDQNGHGTAMSGILAGDAFTYAGKTYAGIAQGAKIIPLKVSDPTGGYNLAFAQHTEKALQWIEKNYKKYNIGIISMSVRTPLADYNNTYADEISRLVADGLFIAAAGGQESANSDVEYPGRSNGVFAVSVIGPDDTFPTDSVNRGPGIDLLAPGDGVPILLRGGGVDASAQATSYATPFAAATAALLKQADPTLTAGQITTILKNTGASITDTSKGLTFSGLTYKRLDVYKAVKAAVDGVGTPSSTGTISGVVFNDANADGAKGRHEKHALAAVLFLDLNNNGTRESNEMLTSSSRRSGNYAFLNVPVGSYVVRQIPPAGYRQTLPSRYYTANVTANGNFGPLIFGDTTLAYLSGSVFNDLNANGIQNTGEAGLAGWQVWIDTNSDGRIQRHEPRAYTDSDGNFVFSNLPPGTWLLRISLQSGYSRTTSKALSVSLASGSVNRGIVFGQKQII